METPEQVQDRIHLLIQELGKNPNAFSVSLQVSGTQIYHIIKGKRNKPSFDLLAKICEMYPQVSLDWLVLGKGTMFRNQTSYQNIPNGSQALAEDPVTYGTAPAGELPVLKKKVEELEQQKQSIYEKYDKLRDKYIALLERNNP